MNKLFFVVPVYNVEKYLARCIDSLLAQTYSESRIILVDDGSADGCGAICDSYAARYKNTEVIHQSNGGLSAARNAGLERALELGDKADYITFIDSDDFVRPDYGERLIALSRRFSAPAVQCRYEKGSAASFSEVRRHVREYAQTADEALLGYELKSQVTPKLYTLSLFGELRFRTGVLNEDEFITYRLISEAGRVAFSDERLYYYYQRPDSIMDTIAKRLKNNPHRDDWLLAYTERCQFFEELGRREQVLRTMEKICTDIILRYSEQLALPKDERDDAAQNGEYIRTYRYFYRQMIRRSAMPLKRRLMHTAFYVLPQSASLAARFTNLRK